MGIEISASKVRRGDNLKGVGEVTDTRRNGMGIWIYSGTLAAFFEETEIVIIE